MSDRSGTTERQGVSGCKARLLRDGEEARWDGFVAACSEATFFHRAGWRGAIERGLGHRTHYLLAERHGEIEGVLPLAEVRSRLFGHGLTSLPGCVYGGVAAATVDARNVLTRYACELAEKLAVDALEMRNPIPRESDWPAKDLYVTFRKRISAEHDENLKAIPRKQRAMVRKGIKAGLQGRVVDDLDAFLPIYAESVRNLGTPVFPKRWFRALYEAFPGECELSVISHGGEDIAGVMSFYFRNEVLPYYGGSRPAARSVAGNDFMYWDLMRRAADRGVEVFDYGRSKQGTGSFSFKKNWGFTPQPLSYEYYLVKADRMPEVNPNNPKYRWFIEAWKRLPLPLANALGPVLARKLG